MSEPDDLPPGAEEDGGELDSMMDSSTTNTSRIANGPGIDAHAAHDRVSYDQALHSSLSHGFAGTVRPPQHR